MTTDTFTPPAAPPSASSPLDGLGRVLRSEWTKFRSVRGWIVGLLAAAVLMDLIGLFAAGSAQIGCASNDGPQLTGAACRHALTTGPGGVAVVDSYTLLGRSLTGDGTLTVRLTGLTGGQLTDAGPGPADPLTAGTPGLEPWSKAGIMITVGGTPGAAYAALVATGSHGVRLQYDYTHDVAGLPGAVSASSPRWLRLTRSADTVTGYDSTDGTTWVKVGSARLRGLPATVQVGMVATSPDHVDVQRFAGGTTSHDSPTVATGTFDQATLTGTSSTGWAAASTGDSARGSAAQTAAGLTVTGSGDIAPLVPGLGAGPVAIIEEHLVGAFLGLLVIAVVAALVATSEYRRGLIRVTLAATPRRGQVLAAKAAVVAGVTFVVGVVAAVVAVAVGQRLSYRQGLNLMPVSGFTEARVVVGIAALLAVGAVFAVAVAVLTRRALAAVGAVLLGLVFPYLAAATTPLPESAARWLLRVTPAAGFAIGQSLPSYHQVTGDYTPPQYFPLPPWGGFAVLCGYTAAALLGAYLVQRRRDA